MMFVTYIGTFGVGGGDDGELRFFLFTSFFFAFL